MRRQKVPYNHKLMRVISIALSVGCLLLSAGVVGVVLLYQHAKGDAAWPHVSSLDTERIGQNSIIYDSGDKELGVIAAPENRKSLKLKQMGEYMPEALVSIEDRRFYSHDGIDRRGIARAMIHNIKALGYVEGASSIDQQLVRNLYPEIDNDKTLTRKMKEASLAQELNRAWAKKYGGKRAAKDHILELYLNLVFFGNNAYGADAAAHTYFDKPADQLQAQEAAMIVGLVQNPSAYDPFKHPEAAKARRQDVLDAMHAAGKISASELKAAKATDLGLKRGKLGSAASQEAGASAPYFVDYVKRAAVSAYGEDSVSRGGLHIYTTLDPKMQKIAVSTMRSVLNRPGDPVSAIVVIENKSGAVRAMASSTSYGKTQFNFAADAKRQPGSTAKIWALSALVQGGVDPDQIKYLSTPLQVIPGAGKAVWKPQTYEHTYSGLINVREATVESDNTVFAQIGLDIGPARVAQTAKAMGITTKLEATESIALGSQAVTPLELTSFYSTIARGGVRVDPYALRQVTSVSGRASEAVRPVISRVLLPWQASVITSILEDNVDHGTGTAAQLDSRPVGGKTGTTDDYKDAWFCGITPTHTACVWVGYPKPKPMTNVHGIKVAGGTLPAQIWHDFMSKALMGVKAGDFTRVNTPKDLKDYVPGWCNRPDIEVIQGPKNIRCSSTHEDNLTPQAGSDEISASH